MSNWVETKNLYSVRYRSTSNRNPLFCCQLKFGELRDHLIFIDSAVQLQLKSPVLAKKHSFTFSISSKVYPADLPPPPGYYQPNIPAPPRQGSPQSIPTMQPPHQVLVQPGQTSAGRKRTSAIPIKSPQTEVCSINIILVVLILIYFFS